jgi:pyruvate kinase
MLRKTRIVCTIGPSSDSPEVIRELIEAGMNVARLNFSHGDHETHRRVYENLRTISADMGRQVAILQDLCGPKIRLGEMADGIVWETGQAVRVYPSVPGVVPPLGQQNRVWVTYPTLVAELRQGNRLLIDDGKLELVVLSSSSDEFGLHLETTVVFGGLVKSRKGVNLPGATLSTPALTAKDEVDLRFGLELGVDWVALSFVRRAADLDRARLVMDEVGIQKPLMAKIEKDEALIELEDIVEKADGIMVARGDLGIEVALEEVPLVQKRAILLAIKHAKPVVTATQMLESMVVEATPTRAEVTDIANAIFDGSDAVMLSAETASGKHPVRVVQVMDRIIRKAETALPYENVLSVVAPAGQSSEAVALAACEIAEEVGATAILAFTHNGTTVRRLARYRPRAPIIAMTSRPEMSRRLMLTWGVVPLPLEPCATIDGLLETAVERARQKELVHPGDAVVCVAGLPMGSPTNFITYRQV